ncbi:MAG: alpha/beta hydrolase [Verrucomicrobia bacterium]|nr:alpha/beta hydrolase [Verrucomicrobiota bacterium]
MNGFHALLPITSFVCRVSFLLMVSALTLGAKAPNGLLGPGEPLKAPNGLECIVHRDLPYPTAYSSLRLDVYRPANDSEAKRPAVLLIHGGGWAFGDKGDAGQVRNALFLAEEGCVAVSINYTLTLFSGGTVRGRKLKAAWPTNLFDCKSALRWMKKNAEALGIDPHRIAVWGGSAGGHLALLTGLTSHNEALNQGGELTEQDNSVRCIIDFFGAPDVREFPVYSLLDDADMNNKEVLNLASPIEHLSTDSPPILIIHGAADEQVEQSLSEAFVEELKRRQLPHEYLPLDDVGHGFGLIAGKRDLRPILRAFLKKHL